MWARLPNLGQRLLLLLLLLGRLPGWLLGLGLPGLLLRRLEALLRLGLLGLGAGWRLPACLPPARSLARGP
jgi:hypothetical protein